MSVPSPPLSRAVQRRVLGTLLTGDSRYHSDAWEYAVGKEWLNQLKAAFTDLQKTDVTTRPLTSSFNDSENIFLGESVWKVLVSWYGLADDYELHRRPSSSIYMRIPDAGESYVLTDKNLDFVHVSMCLLDHIDCIDKQLYQQVYMWDDFKFVDLQLRRALGITVDRRIRMWISIKKRDEDVFLGRVGVQEIHTAMSFGSFLCSKIPDLMQVIQKRQELPPPTAPLESMNSFSSLKTHLSETLQSLGISVVLCAEDTGSDDDSTPEWKSTCISGIHPGLIVSRQQLDWARGLDDMLDTFEQNVLSSAKTKRDEISRSVRKIITDKFGAAEQINRDVDKAKADLAIREKRLENREKELDEREHDLNIKVDKFKRGLTDYLLQKKRLTMELEKIEQQNKFADMKVELNIGGVKYTTSTVTLTKEPDSLLALMFSGRHSIQKEADGSYFIDRDGTNFRHILNYLRDGQCITDGLSGQHGLLNELLVEADYYQLSKLSNAIRGKLYTSSSNRGPNTSLP